MTKEIQFSVGNTTFKLQHFLGYVFDTNVWSETHVYGRGGGGTVQIDSVVVDKKEIWVRNAENVEAHFSISAPVAPGQKVSVFSFINASNGNAIPVGYCNYASCSGFNYYPADFSNTLTHNKLMGLIVLSLFTLGGVLLIYVPLHLSENKKKKLMLEKLIEFGNEEVQLELAQPSMPNRVLGVA